MTGENLGIYVVWLGNSLQFGACSWTGKHRTWLCLAWIPRCCRRHYFRWQRPQKAASEAAKAMAKRAGATLSAAGNVDWSKLVNRPPLFEHTTTEAEIKGFRDWSWQVSHAKKQETADAILFEPYKGPRYK